MEKKTVKAKNRMLHNKTKDDKKSDTRVFIEKVLPEVPDDWMDNPVLFSMMEGWISYNKIAFMTNDPAKKLSVYIFNVDGGVWVDKMWFSNNIKVNPPVVTVKRPPMGAAAVYVHPEQGHEPWRVAASMNMYEQTIRTPIDIPPLLLAEPTLEQLVLEEGVLGDLRADAGIYAPIVMSDFGFGWLCYGCDEQADGRTGL